MKGLKLQRALYLAQQEGERARVVQETVARLEKHAKRIDMEAARAWAGNAYVKCGYFPEPSVDGRIAVRVAESQGGKDIEAEFARRNPHLKLTLTWTSYGPPDPYNYDIWVRPETLFEKD